MLVLFSDKRVDRTNSQIMQKLDSLRKKAIMTNQDRDKHIITKEAYMDLYHGYVDDLFDILCAYVPHLLEREPFLIVYS